MKTETRGNMKHDNSVANDTFCKFDIFCLKQRLHEQLKAKSYPMVRKSENFVVIGILKSMPYELMQTKYSNLILIWSGKYNFYRFNNNGAFITHINMWN